MYHRFLGRFAVVCGIIHGIYFIGARNYYEPVLFYSGIGALACALIMPLVLFCVSANNYKNTGYYHYNSSKVFNVWAYNTTNFLNMKYGNDSGYVYKNEIYRLSLSQPDFKRQYEFVDSACTHVLISNITSYSMFHAQGVVNFFLAPGREFVNGYMGIPDSQPKSFIKELKTH